MSSRYAVVVAVLFFVDKEENTNHLVLIVSWFLSNEKGENKHKTQVVRDKKRAKRLGRKRSTSDFFFFFFSRT